MPRQDCKNYSRKRRALRWNARAAIFLAAALVIMLNYIASRHGRRVDLSQARYFALTPATLQMLDKAPGPIKIIALMSPSHELFRDIRLLRNSHYGDKVQVDC